MSAPRLVRRCWWGTVTASRIDTTSRCSPRTTTSAGGGQACDRAADAGGGAAGSPAWPGSRSGNGVDCLHGHHVRTAGNHSRKVALSFLKAGSSHASTGTPAAISPKILAERLRRVACGAPCSALIIAALGSSGFMCPVFQSPLRPSHDRSSSSLSPHPSAVATTGDPDQTHCFQLRVDDHRAGPVPPPIPRKLRIDAALDLLTGQRAAAALLIEDHQGVTV